MAKLNERLKELRNLLKLTQKQFAEMLQIKQSYYSALEIGRKDVETSKVPKILFEKLGVSPEWFFNGIGVIFSNAENPFEGVKHGVMSSIVDTLVKEKKKTNPYIYKFPEDLRKERPDLSEMVYTVSELSAFLVDAENIYEAYFDEILQQPKIIYKSYNDFKAQKIKYLEGFLKYSPIVKPLVEAMRKFIEIDFQPFDEKRILDWEHQDSLSNK